MAIFDPAAATAAYMATLSPAAHAKAIAYTRGGHWLLLWNWLVTVVAAVIILKSGILPRLRASIERARPRPRLLAFACAIAFFILDFVIELPWSSYAAWWREKTYALNNQSWGGWAGEQALSAAIFAVVAGLLIMVLYILMRRLPRSWWAWAGGVVACFLAVSIIVAPVLIEPMFNTYTPAPAGPVRDQIVALAKASDVPSDKIYVFNGSKQSNRYTANVAGLFGSARVAMSDTMFAQGADLSEVRGVVGHEMGHYARHHVLWDVLVFSLLAVAAFWLIDRLFPAARRLLGEDARVADIADPVGLPILVVISATIGLLATPLVNSVTRISEADADNFSLRHAHEPDGLSKALVKTIAYRASSPSRLEEIIFYDHPSVERRVRNAMDWKAAHPDEVGKPPN